MYPERISKLKPYNNDYNWYGLEFPTQSSNQKKFEENNNSFALDILFVSNGNKDIRLAYKSKYNGKFENKKNFTDDW